MISDKQTIDEPHEMEILAAFRELNVVNQREVMHFMHSLRPPRTSPNKSRMGSLSHLAWDLTVDDVREARTEMRRNFPRDFPE